MSIVPFEQLSEVADCLVNELDVQESIGRLAIDINTHYSNLAEQGEQIVVWSVLNGGLIFTGMLLPLLTFPLKLDYVHATRYLDNNPGSTLRWLAKPQQSIAGKHVLICDDIYDAGITLKAIIDFAYEQGAKTVQTAVLTNKIRERSSDVSDPMFQALNVADRYVFGMGMDYNDYWRNLPGIWALKET